MSNPAGPSKRENNANRSKGLALAMGGMLGALVFVATCFVKLPVPIMHGYVHLGDGVILLGACLLGWWAVPAAAVGSLLSDLLLGYVAYVLPTTIIKGAVAAIAVLAAKRSSVWMKALLFVLAEALMTAGYFVAEWLLLGYGLAGALADVAGNAIQGVSGVIIAMLLLPVVQRIKLPKR